MSITATQCHGIVWCEWYSNYINLYIYIYIQIPWHSCGTAHIYWSIVHSFLSLIDKIHMNTNTITILTFSTAMKGTKFTLCRPFLYRSANGGESQTERSHSFDISVPHRVFQKSNLWTYTIHLSLISLKWKSFHIQTLDKIYQSLLLKMIRVVSNLPSGCRLEVATTTTPFLKRFSNNCFSIIASAMSVTYKRQKGKQFSCVSA